MLPPVVPVTALARQGRSSRASAPPRSPSLSTPANPTTPGATRPSPPAEHRRLRRRQHRPYPRLSRRLRRRLPPPSASPFPGTATTSTGPAERNAPCGEHGTARRAPSPADEHAPRPTPPPPRDGPALPHPPRDRRFFGPAPRTPRPPASIEGPGAPPMPPFEQLHPAPAPSPIRMCSAAPRTGSRSPRRRGFSIPQLAGTARVCELQAAVSSSTSRSPSAPHRAPSPGHWHLRISSNPPYFGGAGHPTRAPVYSDCIRADRFEFISIPAPGGRRLRLAVLQPSY